MNYKTLLLLTGLLCQPFFGLLLQRPAVAGCEANIAPGDYIREKSWVTCNRYRFVFQSDGNLVLYSPSGVPLSNPVSVALWATGTNRLKADKLKLSVQSDGNVVLYEENRPIWASDTSGNLGSRLVLQDDGNLVVYKSSGQAIFSTGTNGNRKSTLSASRTWLTRYIPGLLRWNDETWDKESGDGYHFDNLPKTKGGKTGISETSDELKKVSKDLSRNLLQSERYMTTGYAYDVSPPYYNAKDRSHAGIDYAASAGEKVFAVVPGKIVSITGNNPGKFITVESEDGRRWIYGHINSDKKNDSKVAAGEQIGTVASQAKPHFHIEVHTSPFDDTRIVGGIPYETLGEFNFVLSKTVSPLQAYWEWRNR